MCAEKKLYINNLHIPYEDVCRKFISTGYVYGKKIGIVVMNLNHVAVYNYKMKNILP